MSGDANWTGTIDRLRLDPCNASGANVEIDYVLVEAVPDLPDWVGSEEASETGGASLYAKAQSFKPPFGEITGAEVYTNAAASATWEVRILSGLPATVAGPDLDAKTLATSSVSSSAAGWVSFPISPGLAVTPNRTYYLFVGSYATEFGGPVIQNWWSSTAGAYPGPYVDGTGWIYVSQWSDNSNTSPSVEMHRDYAFRIWGP